MDMDPVWQHLLRQAGQRLDKDILPRLYRRAGLRTADIRRELEAAGDPYFDPTTGKTPGAQLLDDAAVRVIGRAARNGTVSGAFAGFWGAMAIPPEVMASMVQTLRLGQRLAVVYGHDPDTARGKLLLWKAVAAAYELDIPPEGTLDFRLQRLAQSMQSKAEGGSKQASDWVARTLAFRVVVTVTGRSSRLIPGLGAGLGAWGGRKRLQAQGERMHAIVRRYWSGAVVLEGPIEEAVEV